MTLARGHGGLQAHAAARQVVRLHNGEITVKSQIDKGSTFTLVLPLSAAAPRPAVAKAAA